MRSFQIGPSHTIGQSTNAAYDCAVPEISFFLLVSFSLGQSKDMAPRWRCQCSPLIRLCSFDYPIFDAVVTLYRSYQ